VGYTLIVTEKPTAARAIAEALAKNKPRKMGEKAVWYEFEFSGKKYIAAPAVGHLFTLKQANRGWKVPVFDVEWMPSFKANRFSAFSEPYFRNIEHLAGKADDFIIATDYDDEGEVIGYNILRFICKRQSAKRMKFSTMTKDELLESYKKMINLDKNLVEAGLARHYLDWFWGINLTRALTLAIKFTAKRFRILSTGRVQGPVLHMLAKHEKKIKSFNPKPFWQIEVDIAVGKTKLKASYIKDKIWNKDEADVIFKKTKVKMAEVKNIAKKVITQKPPKPYNTTGFLADIYRYFGYSPQQGLSIAESLYQAGLISYPRTSSEKLPPDINYKKIISAISKQSKYEKDAKSLLSLTELKPEEGARSDPAHPAIYPTGIYKKMGEKQQKVYDLVVRRFLACFGQPAKRESQKILLDIGGEIFFFSGIKTIDSGWTSLYGKYAAREEIILPDLNIGDRVNISGSKIISKETQPPPRFSQGSVLKEMENRNLGTKATRAQILQILYNRGYLIGRSITVTELGMHLSDILEKNVPDVVSEKLTRHFEEKTESVLGGRTTREEVLDEAKKKLTRILSGVKKKEKLIGEALTKAVIESQDRQNILGGCIKCGGTLKIHKSFRTKKRFVGCTGYKKGCRVGFPLPKDGTIMPTEKICDECKTPIIQVHRDAGRPFRMCLDPLCKTKSDWLDAKKLKTAQIESRKQSRLAKQLVCDICKKSFSTKRALTIHKKTHSKS
jgi:DNA topoisomerase-1